MRRSIRVRIAAQFHDLLPLGGLTEREARLAALWTPERRQAAAERLLKYRFPARDRAKVADHAS